MRVAFLSNVLTPHQIPFCRQMCQKSEEFVFIQQKKHARFWYSKGEKINLCEHPYVVFCDEDPQKTKDILENFDVVIAPPADLNKLIPRMKAGRLTLACSERFYKEPFSIKNIFRRIAGAYLHHGRYQKHPVYMLCASAYTARDAAVFGNYKGRCYRWGYFPEIINRDIDSVVAQKNSSKEINLLWVGRLTALKRPERAIVVAQYLKQNGINFRLNIVGGGEMYETLQKEIEEKGLTDCVFLTGTLLQAQVRMYMDASDIFLFTSNRLEGWGAVLNEAMNGGCVPIADRAIGASEYLIKSGQNGYIYSDLSELCECALELCQNSEMRNAMAREAYNTVALKWNAQVAAKRLLVLSEQLIKNKKCEAYEDGPCSPDLNIK